MIIYEHKTVETIEIKKLPWYKKIIKNNDWYWAKNYSVFRTAYNLVNQQYCKNKLENVILIAKDDDFLYFYYDYEFCKIEVDRLKNVPDKQSDFIIQTPHNDISVILNYFNKNSLPIEIHNDFDKLIQKDPRGGFIQYKLSTCLQYHQFKLVVFTADYIVLHLLHNDDNTKICPPKELLLSFNYFYELGFYKTLHNDLK